MTEKKNQKKNNVFMFSDTDVAKHTSSKQGVKYLNWAYVVATLKAIDPSATYTVKKYPEINLDNGLLTGRKVDYCEGVNGEGAYVTVTVTFRNKSHTESLPVYESVPEMKINSNGQRVPVVKHKWHSSKTYTPHLMKARRIPNSMTVNKAIKRCFVKASAMLTGLGIGLYIDGNDKGVNNDQNSNGNDSSNYPRRSYSGRSRNRNYPRNTNHSQGRSQNGNNSTAFATEKQVGYIKGLIKQTTSDGSEQYKWLKNNYKTLNSLEFGAASRFIKYLQGLKTKQANQKANSKKQKPASHKKTSKTKTKIPNKKDVKNPKQTTLLQ